MIDETLQEYKRGMERRIADLLSDFESTTGIRVGFIEMESEWVNGPDGPELKKRKLNINFVQP